jgi:hypothetical protein
MKDDFDTPTPAKKRGHGKRKGNSFERTMAKMLSCWWSNDQRDDLFWRTASSGGRATQRKKSGKNTGDSGDIASTDPDSVALTKAFSIELKAGYNTYTLDTLLHSPETANLITFFDQAQESQSQSEAKSWLVIHKIDRRPWLLYMPTPTFNELCLHRKENQYHIPIKIPIVSISIPRYEVTAMLFGCFTQMFRRQDIERLLDYI